MFNENFSFLSGTADPISINTNSCNSADISPFTSRCSSPHLEGSYSSRYVRAHRDSRYDTYSNPRNPSISALTAQLESHALSDQRRASYTSDYTEHPSPAGSDDQDEGYYEGPDTPATSVSDYSDFDPSLYDLSMTNISATSSPRPSLSLEAQATSSYSIRRRQRQALVRLQCLAKRTPDLAMLIEECHPSSLPLNSDALWAAATRAGSTCNVTSGGRIEKERRSSASVRKSIKIRKRA